MASSSDSFDCHGKTVPSSIFAFMGLLFAGVNPWLSKVDWTVMTLFVSNCWRTLIISSYVDPSLNVPSDSALRTKSPGSMLPDFRACPGLFGPPSTNLVIRHPYIGDSLAGSNWKPTGPGDKTTVLSVGLLSVPIDDENNDDRGVAVDASNFSAVTAFDLLEVVDCGVRRTLTFFFRLDCVSRCNLSALLRSGVPNFLAALFDVARCYFVKMRRRRRRSSKSKYVSCEKIDSLY